MAKPSIVWNHLLITSLDTVSLRKHKNKRRLQDKNRTLLETSLPTPMVFGTPRPLAEGIPCALTSSWPLFLEDEEGPGAGLGVWVWLMARAWAEQPVEHRRRAGAEQSLAEAAGAVARGGARRTCWGGVTEEHCTQSPHQELGAGWPLWASVSLSVSVITFRLQD